MRRHIILFASFSLLACDGTGPVIEPPDESLVRFDPEGDGFYRTPWPSDARLTPAGTPDMTGFPGGRPVAPPLAEIEARVSGFATMPVVYFGLTAPVSADALPQGLDALDPESPIQMIDLSEEGCGRRLPLEIEFAAEGDAMRDDNMLQVANAVGTVLAPRTPYGVIVLESFGGDAGPTVRPAAFDRALRDTTGVDALSRSLEPLRRCLPEAGVALDDVAVATVFTTQDPIGEMQALRDLVMDPERLETRAIGAFQVAEAWSRRRLSILTYSGTIELPIFQDGETPYTSTGGAFVFEDGEPVVQRWESVDMAIAARTFETPPAGPRPVLVFMDGTGWTPWGHLTDNWISEALDAGYVVMSFMPQFHGGRAGFTGNTETTTFNLVNPSAVRTNFRQEAAEISYFIRLIRERIAGLPGLPPLDTERLVYGGHSQGALCGAIVAAVEDQFEAYVFSGLSSYLTFTVLYREDIVDFSAIVSLLYGYRGTLDRFSPLLQMMQMGGEVVDPHNYVRRWHGWAENPGGNHVFVSNGLADTTTTPRGMEHMTMAADMPPLAPPGWDVDPVGVWGREPVSLPVSGNEVAMSGGALTIATYLDPTQGHGTIYRRPFVRELAIHFWDSARAGTPTLSSRSEYQCGDGADDDVDGMIDCADPDCASRAPCVEGACDNGVDEDENGLTDCADPVCASAAACQEAACGDGVDDDGDGLTDCADPDCARRAPCAEQVCDDGMDDDGDGDVDCADSECAGASVCRETRCNDEVDNDRDGAIDCADSECRGSPACPERACTGGVDDDGDGLIDCADPDCASATECPRMTETDCGNGADDDGDGAIDCADADCGATAACAAATCADATLGSQLGVALFTGTLDGAGNDYPPGDCVAFGAGAGTPDVALEWTAPAAGEYVISTRGSQIDTVLHVLAASCEPASELACDDDDAPLTTSEVAITLEAGQTVVIVVSAYDAADHAGPFTLHIHPRP